MRIAVFLILFIISLPVITAGQDSARRSQAHQLENAVQQAREHRSPQSVAAAMEELAQHFHAYAPLPAKDAYYTLRAWSIRHHLPLPQAQASLALGLQLMGEGYRDSSLYYLLESLTLAESKQHDSLASAACQIIGAQYKTAQNYPLAHLYTDKGLLYARRSGNDHLIVLALGNKAMVYTWDNQPDKAIAIHQQTLTRLKHLKDPHMPAKVYMSLSGCYVIKNEPRMARYYLQLAEEKLMEDRIPPFARTEIGMVTALIRWELRDTAIAEARLLTIIPEASGMAAKYLIQRSYDTLRAIEESRGNYRQALSYSKLAHLYRDSISGESHSRRAQELEARYATVSKDKALAESRLRVRQQQLYFWIPIAALGILGMGVPFFFHYYRQKREMQRKAHAFTVLETARQAEEKVRQRIATDLHDGLSGMIAAVSMHFDAMQHDYPVLQQSEDYSQMKLLLAEASGEVRKTAHNLMPELLMKHGLSRALEQYCRYVSNSRLTVTYVFIGEAVRYPKDFELLVYRIVQELLHNVVKHANASSAVVQLYSRPGSLSVTVEDNGIGLSQANGVAGLGMESIRNRVQSVDGTFSCQSSEAGETSIYLEFSI